MNPDTIVDALRNPVRRKTVAILGGNNEMSRDRLTAILATTEATDDDDAEQARRRVRLELHHNHLPRLADAGLIEYDEETVTPTPRLETVAQSFPLPDVNQTSAQV